MNITEIDSPQCNSNSWAPIVTNVMIALNIIISLGKQFLNSNKHASLKNSIRSLKERSLQTEGIELNVPEDLKSSVKKE